jgi:5'-3' exoribonuclease 1
MDGPAPRAKLNQQRSRRFLSAIHHAESHRNLKDFGFDRADLSFENNSISPGTKFMCEMNRQLEFFVAAKFSEDERWKGLRVIVSGNNVPGEGEHKIL